jgi:hypothetical protein
MAQFHSRWSDNINQVQQQLNTKDGQLKICIKNIDDLSAEVEEEKKRKEWAED